MSTANSGAAAPDDFIPAPGGQAPPAAENTATTTTPTDINIAPITIEEGVGQTELILALVGVLALAGLLLLLKNAVRRSLIAGRATMDSANAAAWSWYLTLLIFGALVIAGIVGDLFGDPLYLALTVGVLLVGLFLSFRMTSRAKRSA
ncbi:MAG TPA: hypothetical protein VF631_10510 [Allosphingosinicella sp.]|uniref:hypothetical protein n=1 Tax=Allosphingosinicella sp. TaxID=2823234 RepID=UPI002F275D80